MCGFDFRFSSHSMQFGQIGVGFFISIIVCAERATSPWLHASSFASF